MPILATGNKSTSSAWRLSRRAAQTGLTFIEVMVVVLILGLMASVVILNLPEEEDLAKKDAFQFAARLQAAQEMAIMRGQFIGLDVEEGTYRFLAYEEGAWVETVLPGDRPAQGSVSQDVLIRLEAEEKVREGTVGGDRGFAPTDDEQDEEPVLPEARFEPTGEVEPFTLVFTGKQQVWEVSLDLQAAINVGVPNE